MFISFLFLSEERRNEKRILRMLKERRKKRVAGERLQANMGIFCVSRIFGVTHTYVRTNKTVSPKIPRVTHSVRSGVGMV